MIEVSVIGTRGIPGRQGGVERHAEELYPRLVGLGDVEVRVYCRRRFFEPMKLPSTWEGVHLEVLPTFQQGGAEAFWHSFIATLHAVCSSSKIVHFHNIGPSLFCPLARLGGKRVVVTYHSRNYLHERWGAVGRTMLKLGERLAVRFAEKIISVSPAHVVYLASRYGEGVKRKITVIPNGVDRPDLDEEKVAVVLDAMGVEKKDFVLGVGRLVEEKGLLDLLQAYQLASNPPANLVLVGDADYASRYADRIKGAASEDPRIRLAGVLSPDKLWALYRGASLFVLPSLQEGHPLALLEAMSSGTPVVASDLDTTRVLPIPHARLFAPRDVAAVARAIEQFSNVPFTREEQADIDQQMADEFDWDRVAELTRDVYKAAVSEEP